MNTYITLFCRGAKHMHKRHHVYATSVARSLPLLQRAHSTTVPITTNYCNKHKWDGLANGIQPKLTQVPSFPIIGSVVPQLSGIPKIDPMTRGYDFWLAMKHQYGEFYSMGSPSGGNRNCIFRTQYIINDPREMVKVVRSGGKYPGGLLELLWVHQWWGRTRGLTMTGLFGRGEEWRRLRSFLQTGLLHPDAARGYIPGIIEAATLASRGAAAAAARGGKHNLNLYLNHCAFDMFSAMMLGELTETADLTTPTNQENERFVSAAVQGQCNALKSTRIPYEMIVAKMMGFETANVKLAFEGHDNCWEIVQDKIKRFTERKALGQLTEKEKASYLAKALNRQQEEGSNITIQEVHELVFFALFAAVDATSSVIGWNVCHIARLPHVQEKLYNELSAAVESVGGGRLTADVLNKSNVPFLYALIRETQRITPTSPIALKKTVDVDNLEIHGRPMKKGDVVALEVYSVGMDPNLVENPHEFRPERWLKPAVEARKGTPSEIIDHAFLNDGFSQGARKCPGSRVATKEIHAIISQLVLDWKMTSPVSLLEDIEYDQVTTSEPKIPAIRFEPRSPF